MSITRETATVYRGGGRRWFTLDAAVKAEAVRIIKAKYPTERAYREYNGNPGEPGWHWSQLPRSDVLLRRVRALVRREFDRAMLAASPDGQGHE